MYACFASKEELNKIKIKKKGERTKAKTKINKVK